MPFPPNYTEGLLSQTSSEFCYEFKNSISSLQIYFLPELTIIV